MSVLCTPKGGGGSKMFVKVSHLALYKLIFFCDGWSCKI